MTECLIAAYRWVFFIRRTILHDLYDVLIVNTLTKLSSITSQFIILLSFMTYLIRFVALTLMLLSTHPLFFFFFFWLLNCHMG